MRQRPSVLINITGGGRRPACSAQSGPVQASIKLSSAIITRPAARYTPGRSQSHQILIPKQKANSLDFAHESLGVTVSVFESKSERERRRIIIMTIVPKAATLSQSDKRSRGAGAVITWRWSTPAAGRLSTQSHLLPARR